MVVTNKRSSSNSGEISPDVPVFLQSEFFSPHKLIMDVVQYMNIRLAVYDVCIACPPFVVILLYPVPIGLPIYYWWVECHIVCGFEVLF